MMPITTDTPPTQLSSVQQPMYISRIIAYGVAAAVALTGLFLDFFPINTVAFIAAAILIPHIFHLIHQKVGSDHRDQVGIGFFIFDAALCGFFLAAIQLPIEIAILFLIMLNTAAVLTGNLTTWLFCCLALVAGVSTSFATTGFLNFGEPPIELLYTASIGAAIFLGVMAFYGSRKQQELNAMQTNYQGKLVHIQELSDQVSRYVAPQIWDSIFTGRREAKLETQRKKLVVFFSDIVGFSSLSEQMEADSFTDLLNGYLTEMSQIALKYGGTIDKFIGDGIMIFFGDPKSKGTKRDALACVAMAIEMRRHMLKMRKQWSEQGMMAPLQIRMGINTGYCTVGNFGTETRMDYTIIGKEVNLASRLESQADAGEILISHETYSLIKDKIMCRQRGTAMVKGFRDPVPLYQVVDYRRDLGANPGFMNHETEGFSLYLESDKMRTSEKEKVADALEKAATKLRGQVRTRATAPQRKAASTQSKASSQSKASAQSKVSSQTKTSSQTKAPSQATRPKPIPPKSL